MDLQIAIRAYRALTFRGGLEAEINDEMGDEFPAAENTSLIEIRRYKAHRRIERSASASAWQKNIMVHVVRFARFNLPINTILRTWPAFASY
jgi:hypothetical protein